jgi:phage major head subunit gpT-like protein
MIINQENLDLTFRGFKTVFTDAFIAAESHAAKIVMEVPSATREETYAWLGSMPSLREWVGPRHVNGLKAHGFTIRNKTFESTVSVPREDIQDDRLGAFKPFFSEMGQEAKRHPDEMVFDLLKSGFASLCYDGQNFFDTDHPVALDEGATQTVSNVQAGSEPAWFLLDTSRTVRPIIWQKREDYTFESMTEANNPHVFMNREYIYGVHARVNAGFGLWQLAFGSQALLNKTNYAAARAAMMDFRSDNGRLLGVKPTTLVVPPVLEEAALYLLNTENEAGGGSNPWKGTVELIVTPYVAE